MKFTALLFGLAASVTLFSSASAAACTSKTGLKDLPTWAIEGATNITATVIGLGIGTALAENLTQSEAEQLLKELKELEKSLTKRQTAAVFECKTDEKCYSPSSPIVWCISETAKTAREEDGTVFNLVNGDYTLKSGGKGNIYSSPEAFIKDSKAAVTSAAKPTVAAVTAKAVVPQQPGSALGQGVKGGVMVVVGVVGIVMAAVL